MLRPLRAQPRALLCCSVIREGCAASCCCSTQWHYIGRILFGSHDVGEHSMQQLLQNPMQRPRYIYWASWTRGFRLTCSQAMMHATVRRITPPSCNTVVPVTIPRLRDQTIDHIGRALLAVLRAGPVPQHVAFIMDGNRRYARNKGMKVIQGHVDGFVALRRVRHIRAPFGRSFTFVKTRFWKYASASISNSSLYIPLPSTTSSVQKKRSMG
jgi:hypothetical protein